MVTRLTRRISEGQVLGRQFYVSRLFSETYN